MRDHKAGTFHLVQCVGDLLLRQVVQRGGRLVKDQQLGLWGDSPGDHEALVLPAGEPALPFGDDSVHLHGHPANVVRDPGLPGGLQGVLQRQLRVGDYDVGVNVALEQAGVLQNRADLSPQRRQIEALDVLADQPLSL